MRDRLLDHRHGDQALLGLLDAFTNRIRALRRLCRWQSRPYPTIADDDQRAKAKALTAFDDLRHAIDAHDRLLETAVVAIATATILH